MPLTNPKRERFAQELAKGKTQVEAYEIAGYKPNDSNAAVMAGNPEVTARVAEIIGKAAERAEITVERILAELGKIGFSNMLDYMTVGGDGQPALDFTALSRDQAACIQELVVDTHNEREGDETVSVRRVRFKLSDKRAALVDLGKHLRMFAERVEHTGKDGGPIETADVSENEIARRIAFTLARGAQQTKTQH